MSVRICCDFCEKPLEASGYDHIVKNYRTKELNTGDLLPHLCETCAKKLDGILIEAKKRWMSQAEITERVMKLNNERRAELGTSG